MFNTHYGKACTAGSSQRYLPIVPVGICNSIADMDYCQQSIWGKNWTWALVTP